jgi:hypothetical protein
MITKLIDATCVINAAIRSHLTSWQQSMETEKYVIKCDPPFDDEEQKDKGLSWQSNWNFGKGKARAEQVITKNVTEVSKAITLLDILFERFDKKKHGKDQVYEFLLIPEMKADFAERIGAAFFETVLERTQEMDSVVRRGEYESFLYGYAGCVHDQTSIFPTIQPYSNIAFEDHTDPDNVGRFVIFDIVKGEYLYNIYKRIRSKNTSAEEAYEEANEKQVYTYGEGCPEFTASGWNEHALLLLICEQFNLRDDCLQCINPDSKKNTNNGIDAATSEWAKIFTTWEDISLLEAKMSPYWCQINMNNIYLAKVFEIDADGTLCESYCAMNGPVAFAPDFVAGVKFDILYQRKRPNMRQEHLINIIRDVNVENSVYIHDIKGNGAFVGEAALRYDIFRNTLNDKFTLSGLPWIHAPGGGLMEKNTEVKVLGGMVLVGQNMEIVPNQIRVDLASHIQALQIEDAEYQQNMQHVQPKTQLSNRPTKDEVNFVNSQAASVNSADIPQKLKTYTNIVTRVLLNTVDEKMSLQAKDTILIDMFMNALVEEFSDMSLSKENIKKILKCVTLAQVSPVMSDRDAIQAALQVVSTASARKRLTRMFLSTFGFSRRMIRDIMEAEDYGHDAELASIENAMFETTREIVFGLGQDHITHLQAHFHKIDQKFGGLQAGEDPVRAHLYVTNALTNTALHVNAIGNSIFYQGRAKDYIKIQKYFEQKLKELSVELDKQRAAAQAEAQKGQQQGGPMNLPPEVQAKFYLDRIKLMEKIETSRQRTQVAQQLKLQNFALDQELKKQKANADLEMKKTKTDADVNSSLAKRSVEMLTKQ